MILNMYVTYIISIYFYIIPVHVPISAFSHGGAPEIIKLFKSRWNHPFQDKICVLGELSLSLYVFLHGYIFPVCTHSLCACLHSCIVMFSLSPEDPCVQRFNNSSLHNVQYSTFLTTGPRLVYLEAFFYLAETTWQFRHTCCRYQ